MDTTYLIKLTLIGLFAFNWANFNAVANAVIGGLDYVAGATHVAGEFHILIEKFSQYLNAIGSNLNWMTSAILGGIGPILLSLLGFMTGIVLIFAKMMLTLMLGLAPIMIALSVFNTAGIKGRSRIGALTTGEAIGRGVSRSPAAVRSAAVTTSDRIVRTAERRRG